MYLYRFTTSSYPCMIWLDKLDGAATRERKSPETVTFFVLRQFKALVNIGITRKKGLIFEVR